jgi:hypothetical protein
LANGYCCRRGEKDGGQAERAADMERVYQIAAEHGIHFVKK